MSGWAKKTTTTKLKPFSFAGRKVRNEREEQRKKEEERRQREQEEAKRAFQEFVRDHGDVEDAFEDDQKPASGFHNSARTTPAPKRAKLVLATKKPSVKVSDIFGGEDVDEEEEIDTKDTRSTFQKNSNLERFKRELQRSQEERQARGEALQSMQQAVAANAAPKPVMKTTNIFISGMPMDFNEDKLAQTFGVFGPLASVKIMWPRVPSDYRGYLTGFVAYMTRKNAEKALTSVLRKGIEGLDITVDWGKPVPVPERPFYEHPEAPTFDTTGLPFNAQPQEIYRVRPQESREDAIYDALVKVTIPKERHIRRLIHRTIEFVIREGPEFEDELIKRTRFNPDFSFLRDFSADEHVYYRWKLYSVLQYERVGEWDEEPYRVYRGGSMWQPPPVDGDDEDVERGRLSARDRDRLEDRVYMLTADAQEIGDLMYFAITHADAAQEVIDLVTESLSELETPPPMKVARLYLLSDILHNSMAGVANASMYRTGFGRRLRHIFHQLHRTYKAIRGRLRAEQFRKQVLVCLDVWRQWAIFPRDQLDEVQVIFHHGLKTEEEKKKEEEEKAASEAAAEAEAAKAKAKASSAEASGGDIDGRPLTDEEEEQEEEEEEDLDGKPLEDEDSDIDGKPLDLGDSSDEESDEEGGEGKQKRAASNDEGENGIVGEGENEEEDSELADPRAREDERVWLYGESEEEVRKSKDGSGGLEATQGSGRGTDGGEQDDMFS